MPSTRAPRTQRCRLSLEALETREVPAALQPTGVEQLFLEQLNDARANPAAYGQSIGLDLSGVAPSQPLAFNPQLIYAARQHAGDQAARGYFDHFTPEGADPGDRISAAGFGWTSYGESLAGGTAFPGSADALRGLVIDRGVPNLGHRRHLLAIDASFRDHTQVGIGVLLNTGGPLGNYYVIDSGRGADNRPFLTGVVYRDGNNNNRYDVGEGLPGVTISVAGVGAVPTFDSGGYTIQTGPGTFTVTVSGGAFGAPVTQTISVGGGNVRTNFRPAAADPQADDFIRQLYLSSLGRGAADAEVALWRPAVQAAGPGAVADAIERSHEARTRLVRGWYTAYLGRPALNGEEQGWVRGLLSGVTEEQVLTGILGSGEYYNRAGQSFAGATGDERYVQALFGQFLRRTAGAAEVAHFVRDLLPAVGRAGLARVVVESYEYRVGMVRSYYTDLLRRANSPAPGEVNGWALSGLDLTRVRIGFKGSNEYYLNA